jgi:hypothetical protein
MLNNLLEMIAALLERAAKAIRPKGGGGTGPRQ